MDSGTLLDLHFIFDGHSDLLFLLFMLIPFIYVYFISALKESFVCIEMCDDNKASIYIKPDAPKFSASNGNDDKLCKIQMCLKCVSCSQTLTYINCIYNNKLLSLFCNLSLLWCQTAVMCQISPIIK